jgi:predicted 3-demethylubiquinone-9 3-methyltransferase (glyoxalase superfamily)
MPSFVPPPNPRPANRGAGTSANRRTLVHFVPKIVPCLWFDHDAEEAARFYVSVFPNSRVNDVSRYPNSDNEIIHDRAGTVLTVAFELDGQGFLALNAGPEFKFTPAVSFQIFCDTQDEVDHFWDKLSDGGDPAAQQCGWLADRFGLSWQVVPRIMGDLMSDPDPEKARRVTEAMMEMKKLDIAELKRAHAG